MKKLAVSLLLICLPLVAGNSYGKLPISFEPNQGQTDATVKFLARVPGYTLFVTPDEAVFTGRDGSTERMKFIGANRKMRIEPLDKQPGISNYFIGNDPSKWRTNIPNYAKVALREVYPGIDLVFYGNERQLEYDWLVAPGADPKRIRVTWKGADRPREQINGDLTLGSSLRQKKPVILQEGKLIEGGFVVRGKEVAFELAKYDATKPLVIDPVLYSTYLGGSDLDRGHSIAVDGAGNAYVAGYAASGDFPTTHGPLGGSGIGVSGGGDAFVTKINAAGSLVYSTYLGGSLGVGVFPNLAAAYDYATGIALDASGNAYVTGETRSTNFPTTVGSQQTTYGTGTNDAFVTKIDTTGSAILYSTYLGGSGIDRGTAIAVDGSGFAYVTGYTESPTPTFPLVNALQATYGGAGDAFVAKLSNTGTALYSTYFGSTGQDSGQGIAVDSSGYPYITGFTASTNLEFPLTSISPRGAGNDAFVTKINLVNSTKVYFTYLGGPNNDQGLGIAVDAGDFAYVTGFAGSGFPITANAVQDVIGGSSDAFVTRISPTGTGLSYSTYLGGSGSDHGQSIALDGSRNAYVTGYTASTNFPTANPVQAANNGGFIFGDAFVTKFNSTGSARLYSTYLGGSSAEQGSGIAVDGSGNAYVTGYTESDDFTTANPLPAHANLLGVSDAFVTVISGNSPVGVFRNAAGAIDLTSPLSSPFVSLSSGGVFASGPSAAQNANGDTFVVARDASGVPWINVFDSRSRTWDGWVKNLANQGTFQGVPAVAVIGDKAYIVARDLSNAYWTNTFTRRVGFGGSWVNQHGVFDTDPAIAGSVTASGNLFYVVGREFPAVGDPGGVAGIWTSTWSDSVYSLPVSRGATAVGMPSVTVGADGSAYIAIRDSSGSYWMARQSGAIFDNLPPYWQPGQGKSLPDPQVSAAGGSVYAAGTPAGGYTWFNRFTEGLGNNWVGWVNTLNSMTSLAASVGNGQLFMVGRDDSNSLLWWKGGGLWNIVGSSQGVATGPLAAAPR